MKLTELQRTIWRLMTVDERRSIRELRQATGCSSTSVVSANLYRLAALGILQAPPHGQARMWRVLKRYEEQANG